MLILLAVVIGLAILLGRPEKRPTASPTSPVAQGPSPAAFAQSVSSAVTASPKWSRIEGESASGSTYKLAIIYKTMPSGHSEVERDTRSVAQAALNEMVRSGRSPAQERIYLSVWARKPETGATGQPLVRLFGKSYYDFNNDSIHYEPYK